MTAPVKTVYLLTPIIQTAEDANHAVCREREESGPITFTGVRAADLARAHRDGGPRVRCAIRRARFRVVPALRGRWVPVPLRAIGTETPDRRRHPPDRCGAVHNPGDHDLAASDAVWNMRSDWMYRALPDPLSASILFHFGISYAFGTGHGSAAQ